MHRKGRRLLGLVLPDGSKSLIPAEWTNLASPAQPLSTVATTLGSLEDLLHARAVIDALLRRLAPATREDGNSPATKESTLARKKPKPRGLHTDEDTTSLLRRLAVHYPDDVIAGILNRQGRRTASGERFTANHVGSLRRYRQIPRHEPPTECPTADLATIRKAAQILGVCTSTIHRWLNDGFIAGEQVTPGAPWQIRITDELRARFVEQAPPDYLPLLETTMKLGVSRQTVLQRVKRGEIEALLVARGRRKGLRIKVVDTQPGLFRE
jgi:predicted DNA-binding transcriptional regulator AlpA